MESGRGGRWEPGHTEGSLRTWEATATLGSGGQSGWLTTCWPRPRGQGLPVHQCLFLPHFPAAEPACLEFFGRDPSLSPTARQGEGAGAVPGDTHLHSRLRLCSRPLLPRLPGELSWPAHRLAGPGARPAPMAGLWSTRREAQVTGPRAPRPPPPSSSPAGCPDLRRAGAPGPPRGSEQGGHMRVHRDGFLPVPEWWSHAAWCCVGRDSCCWD